MGNNDSKTGSPVPCGHELGCPSPETPGRFLLTATDVHLYRVCDDLSEILIYLMVLFSPWAFGTTQPWSIWTMNIAGYVLGFLLMIKLFIRRFKGYRPSRWDNHTGQSGTGGRSALAMLCTRSLAVLTVAILAYCFVSALNARATFHRSQLSFEYHSYIPWLPHSLDSASTWFAFWMYLGLACSFWAIRDWLPGKTTAEQRAPRCSDNRLRAAAAPLVPGRLRRLLWLLAVNGALLAVEGIVQRLEGSGKLLFIVRPHVNPDAITQFGPYAYRANAAQYFNLLWPVCLGFWWTLHHSAGVARKAHHWLLVCGVLMAACPVISASRGGAFVTIGIVITSAVLLPGTALFLMAQRHESRRARLLRFGGLALFFCAALLLGYFLGWKSLKPRLATLAEDFEVRQRMYEAALPMARDYPVFGTGPGTFEPVFNLYRTSPGVAWPAQLHNDWLEMRITFGLVGSGLVLAALLVVLLRWFAPGGIYGGRRFMILTWLALGGCLLHARYDFPFQIHSLVFLFLTLCSVIFCLTRRP